MRLVSWLLNPNIIFEIRSSVTQVFGTAAFSPAEKNSNLLSSLDLHREWVYIKLLWSGKILLAAVSHRFQNDSQGLKSCMHVSSEGKGEETQKGEVDILEPWMAVNLQTKKDKWKIHIKRETLISEVETKSIWNVTTYSTNASLEISLFKIISFLTG